MKVKTRKTPSAKCPWCAKMVRVAPNGGDWTNYVYRIRHKDSHGDCCAGSYGEVADKHIIWPKGF